MIVNTLFNKLFTQVILRTDINMPFFFQSYTCIYNNSKAFMFAFVNSCVFHLWKQPPTNPQTKKIKPYARNWPPFISFNPSFGGIIVGKDGHWNLQISEHITYIRLKMISIMLDTKFKLINVFKLMNRQTRNRIHVPNRSLSPFTPSLCRDCYHHRWNYCQMRMWKG